MVVNHQHWENQSGGAQKPKRSLQCQNLCLPPKAADTGGVQSDEKYYIEQKSGNNSVRWASPVTVLMRKVAKVFRYIENCGARLEPNTVAVSEPIMSNGSCRQRLQPNTVAVSEPFMSNGSCHQRLQPNSVAVSEPIMSNRSCRQRLQPNRVAVSEPITSNGSCHQRLQPNNAAVSEPITSKGSCRQRLQPNTAAVSEPITSNRSCRQRLQPNNAAVSEPITSNGSCHQRLQPNSATVSEPTMSNGSCRQRLQPNTVVVLEPITSNGSCRQRLQPNTAAVSTTDDRLGVQPGETRNRRHKRKGLDLRVAVLQRNLKRRVMSDVNTSLTWKPNSAADSAEVSDWARDTDNYLRVVFLAKGVKTIFNRCACDCQKRRVSRHIITVPSLPMV
jgi:hypothetical protein